MFSFKNGMQSLPKAIAKNISGKIIYNASILGIGKSSNSTILKISDGKDTSEIVSDALLSTIPAHVLKNILTDKNAKLIEHLDSIYYPPVLVLFLGYDKKAISQTLDGFGFLIPSGEKKEYLGAIWSSTIFQNRCKQDHAAFTIFIGGARHPELLNENLDEKVDRVVAEFQSIMGISEQPIFIDKKMWATAIPQYNLGHIEHENYFNEFENNNPGLFLGGNYRGGISVGDCVKASYNNYEKIKNYLS